MKKIMLAIVLALLLVPAFAAAQAPPGCSWEGDPAIFYTFGNWDGLVFSHPGVEYEDIYTGMRITRVISCPYNATAWEPLECTAADTFCCHVTSSHPGIELEVNPPMDVATPLDVTSWVETYITMTASCTTPPPVGTEVMIIAAAYYANTAGVCDPACGDCAEPNIRISDQLPYSHFDTLILTVVEAPPVTPIEIVQDSLMLVEQGATMAYVGFDICNGDPCAPLATFNYTITSTGHLPATLTPGSVTVEAYDCATVYAMLDAGTATLCTYDTLKIIAWTVLEPVLYDTCVQIVHVVEPQPVPLFTVPVVTILVLALILAAAVFMRRRAAARA